MQVTLDSDHDLDPFAHDEGPFRSCPWCGDRFEPFETVSTVDGRQGQVVNFLHRDFRGRSGIRLYHPGCRDRREIVRKGIENTRLGEYE